MAQCICQQAGNGPEWTCTFQPLYFTLYFPECMFKKAVIIACELYTLNKYKENPFNYKKVYYESV